MASDGPPSAIDANLNGLDGALSAYSNVQRGWHSAGVLRRIFSALITGVLPTEAAATNARNSQQHLGLN
jgi:hypothetical protein